MNAPSEPILDIRGLRTIFRTRGGEITAVNGLDLTVAAGETVALVGEFGLGQIGDEPFGDAAADPQCRRNRGRQHPLQEQGRYSAGSRHPRRTADAENPRR